MRMIGNGAAGAPQAADVFQIVRAVGGENVVLDQTWTAMLAAVGIIAPSYLRSTDATAAALTQDRLAPAVGNVLTLAASTRIRARGIILALDHASQGSAAWDFSFLARRSSGAGSTSFAGSPTITLAHTSGESFISSYAPSFQADQTLDAVVPYFAGVAGRTTSVLLKFTSIERLAALAA